MHHKIINRDNFIYVDEGKGPVLLLLHGLFGALSNWETTLDKFSKNYRVVIPLMPIYQLDNDGSQVDELAEYVNEFVSAIGLNEMIVVGNSLGGHVALIFTLMNQEKVKALVLTGSSGLYENSFGGTFPRRSQYSYVKEKVEYTFYDPRTATKELVDEVYDIVNSPPKVIKLIRIARAAQRHNMSNEVGTIQCPTLLIWGLNDTITPPDVAHEFSRLIPDSELNFIDKCGHAPMMEQPQAFNNSLSAFLKKHEKFFTSIHANGK